MFQVNRYLSLLLVIPVGLFAACASKDGGTKSGDPPQTGEQTQGTKIFELTVNVPGIVQ